MQKTLENIMQLYGIIGEHLEKSFSPKLFQFVFKKLGKNDRYLPFEVEKKHLKNLVVCMKMVDINGLNVTQPYKKVVLKYLDRLDPFAKAAGAVNCIVRKKNKFVGFNTDGPGFVKALRVETRMRLKGKRVTLIGAGGAAFGIAAACKKAGAKVTMLNRSGNYPRLHRSELKKTFPKTDLLVQTTPADIQLPLQWLPATAVVADVRYNPHNTSLLKGAKKRKLKTLDGCWMFVYQAAENLKLWTGKQIDPHYLRTQLP